ncbi:hypothetical protein L0337_00370 [candidate division KSB1 bacterium]|nr:hypothetical protein [candidate division KSB1 bacterium]
MSAAFKRIEKSLQTSDENCRSVQTIMAHVVSARYGCADHIWSRFSFVVSTNYGAKSGFSISSTRPPKRLLFQIRKIACKRASEVVFLMQILS